MVVCFKLPALSQYWQQQVNYTIDVSLNDIEHTLDGFEKIEYINNSPDTLHFIWFHIWPNAYRNDKTAFSEQLISQNRNDFYFSGKEQKGYINRLAFKVDGVTAALEDHPQHIDIIKVVLPKPLAPQQRVSISTPFHVKLPYNFSRGGHVKQAYQITQWYPKPAVYDKKGWHEMPYLDQGEFFSEFGNYDVRITLPETYVVAATGDLQNAEEKEWLKKRTGAPAGPALKTATKKTVTQKKGNNTKTKIAAPTTTPAISVSTKTLQYKQANVHDFAWFADKSFIVNYDTLRLASGRVINVFTYYTPAEAKQWSNSIQYTKDAVTTRGMWLGEYPYNVVSAVQTPMAFNGGMEYPTITNISPMRTALEVELTIEHEVGHNWLYGILASNERMYPWMDEGFNTYYDNRYYYWKYGVKKQNGKTFLSKRLPASMEGLLFESVAGVRKDQPINLPADAFTDINYGLIVYYKTGEWLKEIEKYLTQPVFDSAMRTYYREWQFRHPYPEDFKSVVERVSGKSLDKFFKQLNETGSLLEKQKKNTSVASFFNLKNTDKKNYISLMPLPGYNMYDGFMIGALIHNYQLPLPKFRFFVAPLYGTSSNSLNGIGRLSYSWYPKKWFDNIEAGVNAAKFSVDEFAPDGKNKIYLGYRKLAPYVRFTLKEKSPLSNIRRYIQYKPFFISEDELNFRQVINGIDTSEVVDKVAKDRQFRQVKVVVENFRKLYPYKADLQVDYAKDFFRVAFTGNYFFNYANQKSGMNVRLFAGKFFYTGTKSFLKQFETDRYHLNMSGANGYEDYSYSNYFVGRNKFEKWGSQQMVIRDGGFKVRTDLLANKIGKTDDWLSALNLSTDVPDAINILKVLPVKIPLKVFADIGTYAESWKKDAETDRFLFDAGLQVQLFGDIVNIYVPILFSKVYRDYFKSTLGEKRFWKQISFSIDIQQINLKKINRSIPFDL